MRLGMCVLVVAGLASCDRGETRVESPAKQNVAPATCVDETTGNELVAKAAEQRRAAFAKQLAERGLERVSGLRPVPGPPMPPDATDAARVGKKGGTLDTDCSFSSGCCSREIDVSMLTCSDGTSEPMLFKNAKGELYKVRDTPRIKRRDVVVCGEPPTPPCPGPYGGCGCPTRFERAVVQLPANLTYAGELVLEYDVEDILLTRASAGAAVARQPCPPVP